MIRNGELRLPEMQRRYIWPATRVRDLLDSLYGGYPSGTILIAGAPDLHFGIQLGVKFDRSSVTLMRTFSR